MSEFFGLNIRPQSKQGAKGTRSMVGMLAYRTGQCLTAEDGTVFDYTKKSGIVDTFVLGADEDAEHLARAVDRVNKRKDAQLCREVRLDIDDRIPDRLVPTLVRAFTAEHLAKDGLVVMGAIHNVRPSDTEARKAGKRNKHAHLLREDRVWDPVSKTFGNKVRKTEEENQADLARLRSQWAAYQNRALESIGLVGDIDHRSYAARGIEAEPEPKIGAAHHRLSRAMASGRDPSERDVAKLKQVAGIRKKRAASRAKKADTQPVASAVSPVRDERVAAIPTGLEPAKPMAGTAATPSSPRQGRPAKPVAGKPVAGASLDPAPPARPVLSIGERQMPSADGERLSTERQRPQLTPTKQRFQREVRAFAQDERALTDRLAMATMVKTANEAFPRLSKHRVAYWVGVIRRRALEAIQRLRKRQEQRTQPSTRPNTTR